MAYHINKIEKGEFGKISKIREELEELEDAHEQEAKIMELVELADMLGAIEGYLAAEHPGITMDDLLRMATITKRAFQSGHRK